MTMKRKYQNKYNKAFFKKKKEGCNRIMRIIYVFHKKKKEKKNNNKTIND
jgi:hypothetical protein